MRLLGTDVPTHNFISSILVFLSFSASLGISSPEFFLKMYVTFVMSLVVVNENKARRRVVMWNWKWLKFDNTLHFQPNHIVNVTDKERSISGVLFLSVWGSGIWK